MPWRRKLRGHTSSNNWREQLRETSPDCFCGPARRRATWGARRGRQWSDRLFSRLSGRVELIVDTQTVSPRRSNPNPLASLHFLAQSRCCLGGSTLDCPGRPTAPHRWLMLLGPIFEPPRAGGVQTERDVRPPVDGADDGDRPSPHPGFSSPAFPRPHPSSRMSLFAALRTAFPAAPTLFGGRFVPCPWIRKPSSHQAPAGRSHQH